MRRLNKEQLARFNAIEAELTAAHDALDTAANAFKAAVETAFEPVEAARDKLVAAIETANEFRDEIHDEIQAYFDDRSERWQEGDAGSAYQSWLDQWGEELEEPDEIELPELELEIDAPSWSDEQYPAEPSS